MATSKMLRLGVQTLLALSLLTLAFVLFCAMHYDETVYKRSSNSTRQTTKLSETFRSTYPTSSNGNIKTTKATSKFNSPQNLRGNKKAKRLKNISRTTGTKAVSKTNSTSKARKSTYTRTKHVPVEQGNNTEERNNKTRYLIYLCDRFRSCGGWGDRQRGFVAAYILSIVTNRKFGINMSYPCDIKIFYIPNEINWYIKTHEIRGRSWEVIDWMDNRGGVVDCESDFNKRHPSDVVFLRTNQDIINRITRSPRYGHLVPKDYTTETAFALAWHKLMKLSFHMEEHIEMFMSKVPDKGDFVCAHVRMRKNPTIPNDGPTINSLSATESLWKFLLGFKNTSSRIFIASDSLDVRSRAREKLGRKELDTDGLVLHIDRQGRWSNACLGFEMSLLDQAVLTKCDVLVTSTSGFSVRAAMMSHKKQKLFMFRNGTISP